MNAVTRLHEDSLRLPPHSMEAEQAVLGGLMLDPEKLDLIAGKITEADFYRKDHRMVFRAVTELARRGQPCDAVTLADWFDTHGVGEMHLGAYVIRLANDTPSAANLEAYAKIVREKSVRRSAIDYACQLMESAYGADGEASSILDAGISALMSLQKIESNNEFTLRQAMSVAYQQATEARERGTIPGISTGLSKLDSILGGWHDSDLIVVGARPAMGKTALLLNFAASTSFSAGIISSEQPANQIGARMMAIKSGVPAELMRTGKFDNIHYAKLNHALEDLCDRSVMIYDRSGPSIADVRRMARKWKQHNHMRILFVDYIQRIRSSETGRNANKTEKVGEVVSGLKDIARELDIPVIALAQVSRQAEGRMPSMADLSDSSEIEKEADQIIMLNRPNEYDENEEPDKAILEIEKNRHGKTGRILAQWHAESMRFTDYA